MIGRPAAGVALLLTLAAAAAPASAHKVQGPEGLVCVGVEDDVSCHVVAVSGTGQADPDCLRFGACAAASGTENVSFACPDPGVCVAASGLGDADPDCPGPEAGVCVAASGAGDADPFCSTPRCVTVSPLGNSTGCTSASVTGTSDGTCWVWDDGIISVNSWSASGTDTARGDAAAASGTGDAEGDWVAVSGAGDATCHSSAYPPSHVACVAASGTGEASGNQAQVSGCQASRGLAGPSLCYDPGVDDDADRAGYLADRVAEETVAAVEPLP